MTDTLQALEGIRERFSELVQSWEGSAERLKLAYLDLRLKLAESQNETALANTQLEHFKALSERTSEIATLDRAKASELVESLDREIDARDEHVEALIRALARAEKEIRALRQDMVDSPSTEH